MVAMTIHEQPYQILITDDDEGCRETVREALAENGYGTRVASCGREAIELVRRSLVHVMIVDMNMPDLSGLETVTIIRREMSVEVPTILMSADLSRQVMTAALAAHFESFMPKPLRIDVLRGIVEEIIRKTYEDEE